MSKPLKMTELVLRDGHQSLFATRMRIEDMLPIAEKLDKVGYWSLETWGGATFDACIRYLGEDPWERLRQLKKAMPNTPQQMLFRAQNILGYRHYADDVVTKFVERCATNGIDVFRIFDAMNDVRNLTTAVKAAIACGKHAQGTLSYTVSPVHTIELWLDMAKRLEDMGCHSIAIKDMAGLLTPYVAEELITGIKETCDIPIAYHAHATTGLSTPTMLKAAEAGVDMADASISSMSMTYGHTATETAVAMLQGTDRDTGLDLHLLEEIAAYFREVRKKYAQFEGSLKGIDSRILVAQVPGGMLTNLENQLKEQQAVDKLDAVLEEIPKVRKDLGYIPLVTPTSQIVGTQAVVNVLTGEPFKTITKETQGVLKGEYGATPAPVNVDLQKRVLDGKDPVTCRPADLLEPEMDKLTQTLEELAEKEQIELAENLVDDVLTYALFPQVGIKFLKNRNNPDAFEPAPSETPVAPVANMDSDTTDICEYQVQVDGESFSVTVSPKGGVQAIAPATGAPAKAQNTTPNNSHQLVAPLAGQVVRLMTQVGKTVAVGDVLIVLEAMKMETEVRATHEGIVENILVSPGDNVAVSQPLVELST